MPFRITGTDAEGTRAQSRLLAPSAVVLAMKWIEAGVRDVKIIDRDGESYDLQSFRIRAMETGGMFAPS